MQEIATLESVPQAVDAVVPSDDRRANDTEDDGTGAHDHRLSVRSPPSSPSPPPPRRELHRTPSTPSRPAARQAAGGSRAGAAAQEEEEMSQDVTQRQDVGAEDSDDDGCCIEPCSKEDGEKSMPCEGGCNVRVHLSCYLAQEWV